MPRWDIVEARETTTEDFNLVNGNIGGSVLKIKYAEETATIASGNSTYECSTIPENIVVLGFMGEVTQAPGGGATTLTVGDSNDADKMITASSCDVLGEKFGTTGGNAGTDTVCGTTGPVTLTTNSNVTGASLICSLKCAYIELNGEFDVS